MSSPPATAVNEPRTAAEVSKIAEKKTGPIGWYRTPLDPKILMGLHQRSDWFGGLQTMAYLGLLFVTGFTAVYGAGKLPWPVIVLVVFLHGTISAFMINGVHELCHGTVFQTKWLNSLFVRVLGFLGWINFQMFQVSHARHHRYTLHPPDDLEVVLPARVKRVDFFKSGFIAPKSIYLNIRELVRIARGKFKGEWELKLFPDSDPEKQKLPINWARTILIGHAVIIGVSIYYRLWLLPVVTTLAPFYGGWLFFLCNNTQHIGLQDNVSDFRLCCRTFTVNPFVQFLYWHMNYHTEHHMYAAVPCYKLGRLHRLIQHDLPPCPNGIVATWKEIAAIQARQDVEPGYQYVAPLPTQRSAV